MHSNLSVSRHQLFGETWPLLLVIALLFVPVTWPLVPQFLTHLPGDSPESDATLSLWSFWRVHEHIRDCLPNPYRTEMLFHPLGASLPFRWTDALNALLTAPIARGIGLIPAVNAVLLLTFAACGAASYWLVRLVGFSKGVCCATAILFAFSPFRVYRISEHLNFMAADWAVLFTLCLLMSTYTRRWIIGGLCAGFCAAACSRSGLSFLALPGGIAILYAARFRRSSYRPTQLRPLCAGIALTLVTATSLTLLFALDRQPPLSAVRGGTAWLREFAMLPVHAILTVGVALVARNTLTRNAAFYGAGLLGLALLVERILLPMHTFPPAPEFVQAIRGEAQEVSVLDMSAGDRSALIRQAFHGKRTISGYPDWASPEVLGYIASTPLLRESAPESISAESVRAYIAQPAAAEMTRRVVDFLDIRYVITDRSDNDYPMALFDNAAPARMIAENDFNWVYALEFTPTSGVWPGGVVIGKAEWSLYLARGWGESARIYEERGGRGVIWPVSPNSSVLFKADRPQAVGMGFETFLPPNAANVRMSVTINNHWFRDVNVPTGRHVFRLAFDDALVRAGLNEVEFRWLYGGELYYWNEHGNIPLDLFCVCGVKEKGEQNVFLKSGSQTVYSSRGAYNVIELSDDGGNVLRSGQFEGITSNQPSGTLAAYIESIPEGRLVAVMGTPNTSEELDQRTIDALGLLGVAFDPRGRTGWSHIAIGRKGMTKGEALETWNDRPVSILAPGRCGFSAFQFFAVSRKKGEMAAANQ